MGKPSFVHERHTEAWHKMATAERPRYVQFLPRPITRTSEIKLAALFLMAFLIGMFIVFLSGCSMSRLDERSAEGLARWEESFTIPCNDSNCGKPAQWEPCQTPDFQKQLREEAK